MGSYAGENTSASKSKFWSTYLADSEVCRFPRLTESTNDAKQHRECSVELSAISDFGNVLQGFCEKNSCTAASVFKAVWGMALGSYTSTTTASFTVTNSHLGSQKTCLCQLNLRSDQTVLEFIDDIEAECAGTAPFLSEKLEDVLGHARARINTHVFFQKDGGDEIKIEQFSPLVEGGLILHVNGSASGPVANLVYSLSMLTHAGAQNVALLFGHLIAKILGNPALQLSQIEKMSQRDLNQIWEWNSLPAPAVEECVQNLIDRKANEIPNALAVDASDGTFTHGELQNLSNRLAHHLVELGVGPETIVPLCFEKSKWTLVAMLGVIKAGGGLVFLDPLHPATRSNTVITKVGAKVILSSKQCSKVVASLGGNVVSVVIDNSIYRMTNRTGMPVSATRPSNTLYVIFTSGSTGNPKGCVIEHRSFLTGALAQAAKSRMSSTSRVLQLAAYTFDVSILEILTALIVGACICIPGDEARGKGPTQLINDFRINWSFLTPSLAKMVNPEDIPALEVLVLGGEALSKDDVVTWAPHLKLFNGYGPSECSIAATANGPLTITSNPANIGRALGGICWIVDSSNHDCLVPIGAVGELLIQGSILAREYLAEPEKTRESFFDNPRWLVGRDTGASPRFYKTGDLCRYNSDGSIQFIGRADTQVKLRGLRIELGEIEYHIARSKQIKHSAVVLPRSGFLKDRIVALLSLRIENKETAPHEMELVNPQHEDQAEAAISVARRNVYENLPSYMMPNAWITLADFPLTSSGKIDKVRVARWLIQMPEEIYTTVIGVEKSDGESKVMSDSESCIQNACSHVLQMPLHLIHLDKSFQALGGDSLLAMKLMAHLRTENLEISVKEIMLSRSLSDLALCSKEVSAGDLQPESNIRLYTSMVPAATLAGLGVQTSDELQDIYPCTATQQGILLAQHKRAGAYEFQIICKVMPIEGHSVDTGHLRSAWEQVVQHHPALRTVFIHDLPGEERYSQVVLNSISAKIAVVHCEDENDVEATISQRITIRYDRPEPHHQLTVCRTSAGNTFCAISISHALIDGNSIMILLRDLRRAYEGRFGERRSPLYREYISHVLGISEDKDIAYWSGYLHGANPQPFPVLNDGDSSGPDELHELDIEFDASLELQQFCSRHAVSPSNVFQVAWGMVLKAYNKAEDVSFGYMTSGRDVPVLDIYDMVGAFINTLVCRLDLRKTRSHVALVKKSQEDFLNSLAHQHLSLAQIYHSLPLFGQPLFNTTMTVQADQTAEFGDGESSAETMFEVFKEFDPTEYDITVNVTASLKKTKANLRYWTRNISDRNASNIAATFKAALANIIEHPQSSLGDVPLLSRKDRSQISKWNSEKLKPVERLVHDMFRDQVIAHSQSPAICAWDIELSYAELDSLSTTLACHLSENLGIGPNVLVPTCFDKSGWTVVAFLAILKAGGANVSVDPKHPFERRNQILEDTEAQTVLVAPQHASLFRSVKNVISVERSLFEKLPAASDVNLQDVQVSPSDPVLVPYTSGSTGKSKGIIIEHRSFCSSVSAWAPTLQLGPQARVFNFCAHSFDTSNADLLGTIMTGGCLCIPNERERLSDLVGAINRLGANRAWLTPSVACLLKPSDVPSMKVLFLCGEQIKQQNIDDWSDGLVLVNAYGPAECSINSTAHTYNAKTALGNIGVGLGTHTWIVDPQDHDRLVSIGSIGELLIEGPLCARGYLKNEEKTSAAFIENPKWAITSPQIQSRRFYKTGDLVRYNSDGTVMYLGRGDTQVKVNGQRTELGEIEAHLENAPGIEAGIVLFPKSGQCTGRLVGVISLHGFSSPSGSEVRLLSKADRNKSSSNLAKVREYLEEKVPAFMVPKLWLIVNTIPLTASAKLDRLTMTRHLEAMSVESYQELMEDDGTDASPSTEREMKLREIWARVLNMPVPQVSVQASFLSLGGDSIIAMQLTSACRAEGILISVKDILQKKTISNIAASAESVGTQRAKFGAELTNTPFGLSPIQKLYFDTQAVPQGAGEGHFNQSFLLRAKKPINIQELSKGIATIVSHHSMLRARFKLENAQWKQVISDVSDGSWKIEEHDTNTREEMFSIIHLSQSTLNYESGPVFTTHLFNAANNEQFLFLAASHLVIDLVSWRIILEDIELQLQRSPLPRQAPLSFQIWSQLQREHTLNLELEENIISGPLLSPRDFWGLQEPNLFADVEEIIVSVDADVTTAVFDYCENILQATPRDLILTALLYSFSKVFDKRQLLQVFTEGHGRETWDSEIDLSRTIGWFTTMIPLLLPEVKKLINPADLLRHIKESRNGEYYFAAQMLHKHSKSNEFYDMESVFNYLGTFKQLEREDALLQLETLRDDESLLNAGAKVPRMALFEIYAVMINQKLQLSFSYNKKMKHQKRIRSWIDDFSSTLATLMEGLKTVDFNYALSDFPMLPLTEGGLKGLEDKFRELCLEASNIEDAYPSSPMQDGILISQSQMGEAYRIFIITEVVSRGARIDADRLEAAWQKVVRRHPVLRTIFVPSCCESLLYDQVVLRGIEGRSLVLQSEDPTLTLREQVPMDFGQALPHHQLSICESVTDSKIFLKLEINHALIDGQSIPILLHDLVSAYQDNLEEGTGPLYRDYISYLQSQPEKEAIEYWGNRLSAAELCHFPTTRFESTGELQTINIEFDDLPGLNEFCVKHDVTMANLFQTAWAVVLRAYTGLDNISFGYLSSGRNVDVTGISEAIGPFINMLVCQIDVSSNLAALQAVQKVRDDFISSLPYQHCSLAKIQHAMKTQGQALFNTTLSLQRPLSGDSAELPEISFRDVGSADPTEYDLSVDISANNKKIEIHLTYWSGKITRADAENAADTFATSISSIISSPLASLHALNLLSPRNHEQVWSWNNNGVAPEGVDTCIHHKFSEMAFEQPDAPALSGWGCEMTYRQLDQASTRLAHHLVALGVTQETPVPTCFEKNNLTIAAMIAIWKAGGACVALDPSHPVERLTEIIETTRARVIVGSIACQSLMHGLVENVVVVENSTIDQLPQPATSLPDRSSPSDLAFIFFTSGSTGGPKGIEILHRGFCSLVSNWGPELGQDKHTRALQFCSYAFDTSNFEIFITLLRGGCVCTPSTHDRLHDLPGVINRLNVNWAFSTPSMATRLFPQDVPSLKTLVLGGEAVRPDNVTDWVDHVRLINSYGPAENTISSTVRLVTPDSSQASNIGKGNGSLTWIVDPVNHNLLTPVGCIGELVVQGALVARGYLNDVPRTQAAFIEDPAWFHGISTQEHRFYKTGDLVKYNEDGTLLFVGRINDAQIKLRGQRIEVGEIEQQITLHPHVKHGVVCFPQIGMISQRLVAVVTLKKFTSELSDKAGCIPLLDTEAKRKALAQIAEVRHKVSDRLPSYMVPNLWLIVGNLPLSQSANKIDRGAILSWIHNMSEDTHQRAAELEEDVSFEEPPTETEEVLRVIIGRVLNLPIEKVSRKKSFLNLGGDSLSAMQLISACRSTTISLTMKDVLRSKTIHEMACNIDVTKPSSLTAVEDYGTPFALSPIQQMYFEEIFDKTGPEYHFNQSLLLRIARNVSAHNIAAAIEAVVQRHSILRARFAQSLSGSWTQQVSAEIPGSYRHVSHEDVEKEDVPKIIAASQSSLDFKAGPIFAAELINVSGEGQLLFLVGHHLVIDMMSFRIILQDIEDILTSGALFSKHMPLPFQTWSKLQAEFARTNLTPAKSLPFEVPKAHYDYWGMSGKPNLQGETIELNFTMDKDLSSKLLLECHETLGTEPLDVFLSAIFHSFSKTFDRSAPTIFNEGHGREAFDREIDISETVGWFTTMFPVHIQPQTLDVIESVKLTKDTRRKIPDRGWRYFASRYLNEEGMQSFGEHWPLEVVFNFLGSYQQLEKKDGLLQLIPEDNVDVGAQTKRSALFDIYAVVIDESIRFSFTFSRQVKRQDQVHKWVSACKESLIEHIERLSTHGHEVTVSDFPLINMQQIDLEKFKNQALPVMGIEDLNDIEDIYPCSPMQEAILIAQGKNAQTYLVQDIFEVRDHRKPISVHHLKKSWQSIVDLHSSLRTVFVEHLSKDSAFAQVVLKNYTARILEVDAEDGTQIAALDSLPPIDFTELRPHQRLSISQDKDRLICKLEISHALTDGASMTILIRDFGLAYENELIKIRPFYKDYISYIRSKPLQESVDYWVNYLGDATHCHFPQLNDGAEVFSTDRSFIDVQMPSAEELHNFCHQNGLTLANLLRTVWAMLLSSYTGSNKVCFGYLVSGRDVPVEDIENAIGAFINMLVCSVNMEEMRKLPVLSAIEKIQDEYFQGLPHQHSSLAAIQNALKMSEKALFNTVLTFQKQEPMLDTLETGLSFAGIKGDDPSEYDISVKVMDAAHEVKVMLKYLHATISTSQAKNLASSFATIVRAMLDNPRSDLAEIPMLSSSSLELIKCWNSFSPSTIDICVHTAFKNQAVLKPHAEAICSWDGSFTYSELDEITTKIAHYLYSLGVKPEMLIPVCMERSAYSIISMLSIMKAGGGFVPIDISHPEERLKSILEDCNSDIVLVSPQTAERFSFAHHLVTVSKGFASRLPSVPGDWVSEVNPKNIAYTLFTSGSTGKPKGVVLEHAAVTSSLIHHGREFGFTASARVFQFSSYVFDAMVMEIFTTLVYGGAICVPSESDRLGNIAKSMTLMNVNLSYLTASVVRLIKPQDVPTLRILITGGEVVGQDIVELWADKVKFIGSYGPTECCFTCTLETYESPRSPSNCIGFAVGSHAWIVEPTNHDKLAAVGAVGELIMSGPILSREYLKNPEKTAMGFIENPKWLSDELKALTHEYSSPNAVRFYKTGDLVRYNSNGTMMFLGRKDQQVKLRGLRIELGEIEYHLASKLPNSQSIAVEIVAPEVTGRRPVLAAFFTLPGQESVKRERGEHRILDISANDLPELLNLQESLTDALPSYMIPSLYVPLSFMPEMVSTKIDRGELRRLASDLIATQLEMFSLSSASKKSPISDMEKRLACLWATILDLPMERIGIEDNFFRMGGDSIMAMRLASIAYDAGVSITIANIFRNPDLSSMALVSENVLAEENVTQVIEPFQLLNVPRTDIIRQAVNQCSVESDLIEDAYPCTPLQEGIMALSRKQKNAYFNQRVLRLGPEIDVELFQEAWQLVTDVNPILRTRIIYTDSSELVQIVIQEENCWRKGDTLEGYLKADKEEPFSNGQRLVRFGLVTAGESTYFIFTANHAVYDGVSLPQLFEEAQKAYNFETIVGGTPFNTFIRYLKAMDMDASKEFWKSRFSEGKPTTYPQYTSSKQQVHVAQKVEGSVEFLRTEASDITIPTILRAAWAITISKYAENSDVVFGATLSGRNAPITGVERISGPTITTVPIRLQLKDDQNVQEFLQMVQDQATDMIAFEQAGLQNIGKISAEIKDAMDFGNLIVIQPAATGSAQSDFLGAEIIDVDVADFDTYPLVVEFGLRDNGFDIRARFDEGIISTFQVKKVLGLLEHVFQQLTDPSKVKKLGEIDVFSAKDKRQVEIWNSKELEVLESCVPVIFREQVHKRPKAPAVSAWDGDFTYEELDRLSDRLAHHLVQLGIGPEKLVPLCFDKSCFAVVAMLAVMKAGGACVNLGSSHPQARLLGIIEDAKAEVILVAPQHAHLFGNVKLSLVIVDSSLLTGLPTEEYTSKSLPMILPANSAFVLFTSGSTGRSKGIIVEHGSLCTSSAAHGSTWNIGPGTRVFQFASFSFDVSVADVFTTLQRGGCICLPSEEDRVNDLAGAVTKLRANWAFMTPSVAVLLEPRSMPTLKTLVLGGEAPTREVIRKWADHLDLILCYGPAETTVYCSGNEPAQRNSDPSNLGHPIGVRFWVANFEDHNELVPIGAVGELLLEGRTVARGYLNEPEKTAAAFITNPWWAANSDADRRFYKTGDLVRYNPDGSVRFVARKDTQLKIRGQRVELGEIEANIKNALPQLHHVAVDVGFAKHSQGRQNLVAFMSFDARDDINDVSSDLKQPMTDDLRTAMIQLEGFLSEAMPSYMIPSMYIPLEQIPLTLNGKADRPRLRKLVADMSKDECSMYSLSCMGKTKPHTPMELRLQKVWAEALGIAQEAIVASDNFFRLGGDSITAMKLVRFARDNQISLKVGDIFKSQTLSSMAAVAEHVLQLASTRTDTYERFSLINDPRIDDVMEACISQTPFSNEEVLDVLPATDFQSYCVAHSQLRSRGLLNYFFLDAEGPADVESLQQNCAKLVEHCEIFRTVFVLYGNRYLQVVLKQLVPKFGVYETGDDIVQFSLDICEQDVAKDFVLGEGFVQFYLIKHVNELQHRLVMRMSHSQYDGICLPRVWECLRTGSPNSSLSFAHYVSEVQKRKTPEAYQYWRTLLKGSSMTQVVAHAKPSYHQRYDTRISRKIAVHSLSSSGITFATIIKSAWALVLANLGIGSDVTFGHVISGRNMATPGVENIIGGCVNIVPVRIAFQKEWKVIDLLNHVQEQQTANIPYETLGFLEIMRECTEWPSHTRFSSIVQHQNIDSDKAVPLDGKRYDLSSFCPMADESDIAIFSEPNGVDMDISLICSSVAISPKFAQQLLLLLCDQVQKLSSNVNAPVSVDKPSLPDSPKIPLKMKQSPSISTYSTKAPLKDSALEIAARIVDCWRKVLETDVEISMETSFFDVGGDLIAVSQLAVVLGQGGFGKVHMEDLIDNHTLGTQVLFLS